MHARMFICATVTALALGAPAWGAGVTWAPELERGPGAGYNQAHYDRRVTTPKSILKGSRANRMVEQERRFNRRLGSDARGLMRQRGDVARHSRLNGHVKSTLSRQGRAMDQRSFNRSFSRDTRATLRHRGNLAQQARGARTASRGAAHTARHGRTAVTAVKRGRTVRTLGKAAAGGLVVGAGIYATEQALGVDIPDAVDAAEWTYGTLKDPRNAGRRFEKLGHDSAREIERGVRTLTDPQKMSRNIERSVNSTVKSVGKAGCSVGKLFGAKC